MSTMLERYKSLRQDFLNVVEPAIDSNILNQLKHNYAHEIDSRRKLSKAKDFKTFIRLLEKRDIISCDNIEQLWFITKFIGKPELEDKLLKYENWVQKMAPPFPFYNMYQSDNIRPQNHENATENVASSSGSHNACSSTCSSHESTIQNLTLSFSNITQKYYSEQEGKTDDRRKSLQQTVLLQISERLGRSWRDVARYLGIRECEIDAVQNKYPCDLKEQSFEILKIYISQSDKERWTIDLIRALEKGRRRDLKELVEDLMVSHKDKR
ncbi:fas-associated death domain protein [Harpegnathos saltator]|uniref:Death domain-containing adapter protein BG4 n=1 Tax=Harpegnathos saltator TaxID=610380 RepID=E2BKQ8_HARSA|nr:fas-associated death domain protein [Harpegnathos saltator]EFN83756.1 Death domain-containing adapter protein BG4 [Harpegnathos saltator]